MERKVLNAERIKNKGIKPENLRCSLRSCPENELLFDIYDCKKVLFVGELRIVNVSATFAGKAFKPIEIWLCCDDPLATYDVNIDQKNGGQCNANFIFSDVANYDRFLC